MSHDTEGAAQELFEDVRAAVQPGWRLSDLVQAKDRITQRWAHEISQRSADDLIAKAVSLAIRVSSQGEALHDSSKVRDLCGVSMLFSMLALVSERPDGLYRSTVLATHLAIDILADYTLAIAYLDRMGATPLKQQHVNTAILIAGDKGIALARLQDFNRAIEQLRIAVDCSLAARNDAAAARYLAELGRCYFETHKQQSALSALRRGLELAVRSRDEELAAEIQQNIKVLAEISIESLH